MTTSGQAQQAGQARQAQGEPPAQGGLRVRSASPAQEEQRARSSQSIPARLAAPVLGSAGATRFARPDARGLVAGSWALLALLGVSVLVGIALQAPCLSGGYELPRASFRMCSSPVALSLLGESAAEAPGAITSGLPGFSLLTYWFTVAASGLLGAAPAEGMAILLVVNTAAFAAMGAGMLVLARRLDISGGAAWAAVGFLSPVIVFSIGQSLDPLGVAAGVWACALLTGSRTTGSLMGAGALLAVAAAAGPLGLVVLLGVLLGTSRDRGQAALVLAGFAILSGLLLLGDGRFPSRFAAWFADAVDRGSLASIAAMREWGDERTLTVGLLIVWAFGLLTTASLGLSLSLRRRTQTADERTHLRRTALVITAMLGFSLLAAPGSSTSLSLWLLPFAALTVPHLWVLAVWFVTELGFALAVPLADAAAVEPSTGLSDSWMAVFTLLRFLGLALVTAYAVDRLLREGRDRNLPAGREGDRDLGAHGDRGARPGHDASGDSGARAGHDARQDHGARAGHDA